MRDLAATCDEEAAALAVGGAARLFADAVDEYVASEGSIYHADLRDNAMAAARVFLLALEQLPSEEAAGLGGPDPVLVRLEVERLRTIRTLVRDWVARQERKR